jgi:uncharacterized membrane-anchored protein YhcB (DUF1043 family)
MPETITDVDEKPARPLEVAAAADPAGAARVGRTTPDAVVDVAKLLGKSLPALLVAAGVVVGYLEYRKLDDQTNERVAEAQQKSREQFQSELDAANKAMRESYKLSAELNQQMIGNAKTLVELQTNMATSSGTMVTELLGLKQKVVDETAKFLDAQEKSREAVTTRETAQKELAEARTARERVELEHAAVRGEIDRLKQDLDAHRKESSAKTSKRAEDIQQLRAKLEELVKEIQKASENGDPVPPQLSDLAETIRGNTLFDPRSLLEGFAPASAASNYFDALVGGDAAMLEDAIRDVGVGTFPLWLRATFEEGTAFVGCRVQGEDELQDVVFIAVEDTRVVSTTWLRSLRATLLRDPIRWSNRSLWGVGQEADKEEFQAEALCRNYARRTWSLSAIAPDDGDGKVKLEWTVLRGDAKELPTVEWSAFETKQPELAKSLLESDLGFEEAVEANRRAERFSQLVSELVTPDRIADAPLRERFARLLQGAVLLDGEAASRLARRRLTAEELDRIAALALDDEFKLVGVSDVAANEAFAIQTLPQAANLRVAINAEYTPRYEPPRRVSFVFTRDAGDQPWLLDELREAVSPEWEPAAKMRK